MRFKRPFGFSELFLFNINIALKRIKIINLLILTILREKKKERAADVSIYYPLGR